MIDKIRSLTTPSASSTIRRDAALGAGLGLSLAFGLMVLVYIVLATLGGIAGFFKWNLGLMIFALLHGGSAGFEIGSGLDFVDVSAAMKIGLPMTSFAVAPFGLAFLYGRFSMRWMALTRTVMLACAIAYAFAVLVFALLGRISVELPQISLSLFVGPLSAAFWGGALVVGGLYVGRSTVSRPRVVERVRNTIGAPSGPTNSLKMRARYAISGALIAVVVGLLPTVLFTGVDILTCGLDIASEDSCAGVGLELMFLPTLMGSVWFLSHGLPIGFGTNVPFSEIPYVGEYLANIPSRVSLFGNWPLGGEYRLLVVAPLLGIVFGGFISARAVGQGNRLLTGALISLPYFLFAVLVNILVGITAGVSIMEQGFDIVLRVPMAWMLLLLVEVAILGGIGGLLATPERVTRISALASRLKLPGF